MTTLAAVAAGNPTLASDLNQYFSQLTGVTGTQLSLLAPSASTFPLTTLLTATPSADQIVAQSIVVGDTSPRVAFYLRPDGIGGILGGSGSTIYAHMYPFTGAVSGWHFQEAIFANGTVGAGATNGGITLGDDGAYSYIDGVRTLNLRVGGIHAAAITTSNSFVYAGSHYGALFAGALQANVTSSYADAAEHMLTTPAVVKAMAVCVVADDTLGPCVHRCCRRAKIVSTNPSISLAARANSLTDMTPRTGHESAQPIAACGVVPVLIRESCQLGDRLTTVGPAAPGYLRVATDDEHALGDVVAFDEQGQPRIWLQAS